MPQKCFSICLVIRYAPGDCWPTLATFSLHHYSILRKPKWRRWLLRVDLSGGGDRDQSPNDTKRQNSRRWFTPPAGVRTPRGTVTSVVHHLEKLVVVVDGYGSGGANAAVGSGEGSREDGGGENGSSSHCIELEIVWIEKFVAIVCGYCLNWKVCGYCLWVLFKLKSLFLEKFFLLESEKKKERMKKWRLCVEEKNEEWRDEENRKKEN